MSATKDNKYAAMSELGISVIIRLGAAGIVVQCANVSLKTWLWEQGLSARKLASLLEVPLPTLEYWVIHLDRQSFLGPVCR